jgi:quercetin dioxygenase-like cupin family protein
MQMINIKDLDGVTFPTGRKTRVMIGANSSIQADNFAMGYVEIEPGGSVPSHSHHQEEVYFIVKGEGTIEIDNNKQEIHEGSAVYIPSETEHELINTGDSQMVMMFVYSPAGVVSHWEEEQKKRNNKPKVGMVFCNLVNFYFCMLT